MNALVVLVLATSICVSGFDLSGEEPVNFCKKDYFNTPCKSEVNVYVNRLNSENTLIPYEYAHFDFCPIDEANSPVENLGQMVFGDRIRPGPYRFEFLKNVHCAKVCTRNYVGGDEDSERRLRTLKKGIHLNYQHHWIVDNMPVTWCYQLENDRQFCTTSFPMGCHEIENCAIQDNYFHPGAYYPFNHVDLTVTYHSGRGEDWGLGWSGEGDNGGRIISVKVIPSSKKHANQNYPDCNDREPIEIPLQMLSRGQQLNITYTYSIRFVQNNYIKWSSRWDYIIDSWPQSNIQLFSVLSSMVIVLFLSGMLAVKMMRTLHTEAQEKSDSKLEQFDVFRPPRNGMLLSALLGSGVQVCIVTFVTVAFAYFGFLSAANRGALMSCVIALYVLLGTVAGYVSARIYKSFGGIKSMWTVLLTSMLSPGIIFGMFYALDVVLWSNGSSGAVPANTMFALLALWFFGLVPLTFIGGYFGFKEKTIEYAVHTTQDPLKIRVQSTYSPTFVGMLLGGALPFGCIFVQLFFVLNSIWAGQVYGMFGMLLVVFILLVVTCSETTILLCYFYLGAVDCWWRSFLTTGFTAVYMLLYCIHYFATKLVIEDAASTFLYFGYTVMMVYLFFLLTGTIGFVACFWFMRKIYSAVKDDSVLKC